MSVLIRHTTYLPYMVLSDQHLNFDRAIALWWRKKSKKPHELIIRQAHITRHLYEGQMIQEIMIPLSITQVRPRGAQIGISQ